MDAKELVLETLKKSGTAMKAGEIAEAANIDKKEVDKALKTLKTEEKINSPKRCFTQQTNIKFKSHISQKVCGFLLI